MGLTSCGGPPAATDATSVLQPSIAVIHIDLQLSLVPGARANAFWAVGVQMARTEGVLSLMNGLTASMIREIVYSGFRLGSYEYFKDRCA